MGIYCSCGLIRYAALFLRFYSGFTNGEYRIALVDFIAPCGGTKEWGRRDLRIPPSPRNHACVVRWTPPFPTLGNRCRGLMPILESGVRCGLFVATSTWCLGALCSALYRSHFRRSCLACIFRFSLLGGKKTLFVWLLRTFLGLPLTATIVPISLDASPFHQICRV